MYIECDSLNDNGPLESEMGYVPNNPLFGLPLGSPQQQECCSPLCVGCLFCQGGDLSTASSHSCNEFDCHSYLDSSFDLILNGTQVAIDTSSTCSNSKSVNTYNTTIDNPTNFWQIDEMPSTCAGQQTVDIEPLPSLFQFSPCASVSYNFGANSHDASLSYRVHPHQLLLPPNNFHNAISPTNQHHHYHHHHHQHYQNHHQHQSVQNDLYSPTFQPYCCNTNLAASNSIAAKFSSCNNQHLGVNAAQFGHSSVSVNVNMNMTMHSNATIESALPFQNSHMHRPPSNIHSSVNVMYSPLPSNSNAYSSAAAYSIAADFNAPALQSIPSTNMLPLGSEQLDNIFSPPPVMHSPSSPSLNAKHHTKSYYFNSLAENPYASSYSSNIHCKLASQNDSINRFDANQSKMNSNIALSYEDANSGAMTGTDCPDVGSGVALLASFEVDEGTDNEENNPDNKHNLCRLCGKTYARPSTLKTHLRTHSGERPYRCNDCNKSFSQAANLTAHVRTHTGQKPFRCPICDRRFSQSSSVTTHMRTHSGERPYQCSSCKKSFSDSSTLTKHLRIHSGEKPYQCKMCLLRFSQSGNLNRHMRVHSTENNVNFFT